MTRDEATNLARKTMGGPWDEDTLRNLIELFAALGMLKLDEPKSAREKLKDYLTVKGYGPHSADCFISDIDAAGLKIVEK